MAINVIGYIGEPAAGKSTIMRGHLADFRSRSAERFVKVPYICYHEFPDAKAIIMGIYDEGVFSGTDRLAKTAPPKFREWISALNEDPEFEGYTVYWEGERFSNNPTLDHLFKNVKTTIFHVSAPPEVLHARHAERDNQNATWLKGMATRIRKLVEKYPVTPYTA